MERWARFQKWLRGSLMLLLLGGCFYSLFALSVWGQDPKPSLKTGATPVTLPTLAVLPEIVAGNLALTFEWGDKTPALAVVKGHGKWWVVFDESATVSLPDLKDYPTGGVKGMDTVPAKDGGVILRIFVEPEITPIIDQVNGLWQVSFKHQPQNLHRQASIQLPKLPKEGLSVGLEAGGKEVRFIDPYTGYAHIVIPSYRIGLGVAQESTFPEFQIMATAQGVGFQVLKDGMVITPTPEQVIITHPEGLAVTLPQDREQARTRAMPMGFFIDAQDLDWADRQQKINEELLDLPHSQHGPGELELAWLLLSNGQASEALGYLTHLAQERPSITNLPVFQILQGIGNLLLHRFSESEEHLVMVREEPEVQVWLSILKAIQNPHYLTTSPGALSQFRAQLSMVKPMLQSYPKPLRDQMASLILLAGITTREYEILASILDQETRPDNAREGEVFDLAKARVLISQNKPDAALQMLGELMEKAASPQIRLIARFDYVAHRWETNMMKKEEALLELERVRAQSRENWLEREVLAYLERREAAKVATK